MSKSSRDAMAVEGDLEGTSARTRPVSFEEIMTRRSKKLSIVPTTEPKNHDEDLREPAQNGRTMRGSAEHVKNSRNIRDSKNASNERVKKEDLKESKSEDQVRKKHKDVHHSVKSDFSSRDKLNVEEKLLNREVKNVETKLDNEKESKKRLCSTVVVKDKPKDDAERSRIDRKHKNDNLHDDKRFDDRSIRRKPYQFDKYESSEYSLRSEQRKDRSRPPYLESRVKRRRSRSREYNRERHERSVSLSPRAKRYHYVRNYDEPSHYYAKDKSRRQYSPRPSAHDVYGSSSYRKREEKLGGYSPRKRITEPTVKPPSPPVLPSPEKASTRDLHPPRENQTDVASITNASQLAAAKIATSILSTQIMSKMESTLVPETALLGKNATLDSIQLTQATRPMRRLYVENLPSSVSEKGVMDCLNEFFLSSGVNHIEGTKPCLNCIINREKHQALVEFLTPEDATAALSFDGRSFSGSTLKIRRPKDYVETAVAPVPIEKTVEKPKVNVISNEVKDSSNKIFIAGFSEIISQEMIMEIVSTFGPLASFRFEHKDEISGPCAFLEYIDHSITLKACAGLNGMKLGGSIVTVIQALPDVPEEWSLNACPSYEVPVHVKPLLAQATKVLQLKDVLSREEMLVLPKTELDEMLEDIRIECGRFGAVKSMNLINFDASCDGMGEVVAKDPGNAPSTTGTSTECGDPVLNEDILDHRATKEPHELDDGAVNHDEMLSSDVVAEGCSKSPMSERLCSHAELPLAEQEGDDDGLLDSLTAEARQSASDVVAQATNLDEGVRLPVEGDTDTCTVDEGNANKLKDELALLDKYCDSLSVENSSCAVQSQAAKESRETEKPNPSETSAEEVSRADENGNDLTSCDENLLVPGSVLVEYMREEAACIAAHALHGRLFGDRAVSVNYIPHDIYFSKFPKRWSA